MITGIVIKGDGLGKRYGFPTANLDCPKKNVKVKCGIYAAWVFFEHKKYIGALVIQDKPWKVEVYILDFEGDLYGKYMEVDPVQKISEQQRYDSTEELIEKIRNDIEIVKKTLI